ncbi:Outer dense fiber protein 3-B [Eufriesea mexicana]|uniref:Outer dense fiber protein 3-B n=1 Tax=Eufriesea mexicana TaxID=516756 RepID=A0A310SIU8_9HYME|nr:Outer dense fiber protein 3-B [Eufriesea mexicana]
MPPKPDTQSKTEPDKYIGSPACNYRSPGPKYNLKTLVGFREHCISKHRNPAYTFGNRQPFLQLCEGPGPKYLIPEPKREGFSFGLIGKTFGPPCVPGPKYLLPTPKTPAFTIKSRTKPRDTCFTPGPYNVKLPPAGPAFYIGERLPSLKCDPVPGPTAYNEVLVKQRAPMYSMAYRQAQKEMCRSPGPKYNPKLEKSRPIYSFGIKHSECAPPYFVECDSPC